MDKMKSLIFKLGVLLLLFTITSCSSDEPKTYNVRVLAEVDSDVPGLISGIPAQGYGYGVYFTRKLETSYVSEPFYHTIGVSCKDPHALITLKIWVDGKLVVNELGNYEVGSGQFLRPK